MHIPAILAAGERERVSGKDLITAIFLNFELTGRIVDSFKFAAHNQPPRWQSSTYTTYVVRSW